MNQFPCEKHETEIKNLKEKINSMDGIKETLVKLSTLLEMTIKDEKKRDKMYGRQNEVLEKMTINLTELSLQQEQTSKEVTELKLKVEESEKKDKVSILSTLNLLFTKFILPVGFVGGIVYFISKLN